MTDEDMTHSGFDSGSGDDSLHVSAQVVGSATFRIYAKFFSLDQSAGMYGAP